METANCSISSQFFSGSRILLASNRQFRLSIAHPFSSLASLILLSPSGVALRVRILPIVLRIVKNILRSVYTASGTDPGLCWLNLNEASQNVIKGRKFKVVQGGR